MKGILAIGNPGPEYQLTRHNAGVMLVDYLSKTLPSDYGWRKHKGVYVFESQNYVLVKSAGVFMNESGNMINDLKFLNHDFKDFYLAHDDLDIKLGEYKIQRAVGPKVHHGVESIEKATGTVDLERIRIGIDNRDPQNRIPGGDYVLQRFTKDELQVLEGVLSEITQAINK